MLANATDLARPNKNAHLKLLCGTSDYSIGSVLLQKVDDEIQHLGYLFRSLKAPELSYFVYDKEMLSVFVSVQYFKPLLLVKKFVIFFDHRPLLNAFKNPSPNHSAYEYASYATFSNPVVTCNMFQVLKTLLRIVVLELQLINGLQVKNFHSHPQELAKKQNLDPSCLDMHEKTSITIEQFDNLNTLHKLHVYTSTGIQGLIVPTSL